MLTRLQKHAGVNPAARVDPTVEVFGRLRAHPLHVFVAVVAQQIFHGRVPPREVGQQVFALVLPRRDPPRHVVHFQPHHVCFADRLLVLRKPLQRVFAEEVRVVRVGPKGVAAPDHVRHLVGPPKVGNRLHPVPRHRLLCKVVALKHGSVVVHLNAVQLLVQFVGRLCNRQILRSVQVEARPHGLQVCTLRVGHGVAAVQLVEPGRLRGTTLGAVKRSHVVLHHRLEQVVVHGSTRFPALAQHFGFRLAA